MQHLITFKEIEPTTPTHSSKMVYSYKKAILIVGKYNNDKVLVLLINAKLIKKKKTYKKTYINLKN
jgi:hypothetical protein